MDKILNFFKWVVEYDQFIPRSQCAVEGQMPGWIEHSLFTSNGITFISYLVISCSIFWYITSTKSVTVQYFRPQLLLLFGFIFCCGITHLADSGMFYYPMYRLTAFLKTITAVISLISAPVILLGILKLARLEDVIDKLAKENVKLEQKNVELETKRL